MKFDFVKMEGLGNDFVIIDDRNGNISKRIHYGKLAKKLCSRHFGIGADGIILILDSEIMDIKFRIFNADGTEAEMCGNGMRCFAKYLYDNKIILQKKFKVETLAGTVIPEVFLCETGKVKNVKVDMGIPLLAPGKIPFESSKDRAVNEPVVVHGKKLFLTAVSMGNPHAVIFVDDIENIDIEKQGKRIENHERFPKKTNVEFVQVINENEFKMRIWERGAGETLACGTGACAALVASNLNRKTLENALVHLKSGDLKIFWNKNNMHVFMTGPAELVFTGNFIYSV